MERLLRRIEELRAWRNARELAISPWRFEAQEFVAVVPVGGHWPIVTLPVALSASVQVPVEWEGLQVEIELWLGGEGFVRFSTGLEVGVNAPHFRFPLIASAVGGESIQIEAKVVPKGMFGSHIPEPRIERAHLVVPNREVNDFERDTAMIWEAVQQLGDHDASGLLMDALDYAFDAIAGTWPSATELSVTRYVHSWRHAIGSGTAAMPPDYAATALNTRWTNSPLWHLPAAPLPLEPLAPEAAESVVGARAWLADRVAAIREVYPPAGRIALTGHAHIDLAWLWPVAETRRKNTRTFASMLHLMDRYEDFIFNQSSAQVYAWMEEDSPHLLEAVKSRVAEGRWEPIGGSWLEPDGQVTGGEAYVRHLLYGQRYFAKTFGKRSTVAWLPDVFGFSGGLPQIFRGAGLTSLFTIKLNWNEANVFPHDLFEWVGVDGSSVTAHTFFNHPGFGYNGNISPQDTLNTWRNFRGKPKHPESLLAVGWGDGGGGPTDVMLENYARIAEFPALPRLRMTHIEEFFQALPREGLPKWVGELYLEFHRGTLTTQSLVKKLNRESEHRLMEAEVLGVLAKQSGFAYPADEIERAWKTLLLNQFHDILPGSSIHEVYEDTHRDLREVVATATTARDSALEAIAGGTGDHFLIANAGIADRLLSVVLPPDSTGPFVDSHGASIPTQVIEGGVLLHSQRSLVPGTGWTTICRGSVVSPSDESGESVRVEQNASRITITNDQLRVTIAPDGTIAELFDLVAGRAAIADRANQLHVYLDKPRQFDAWDIDESHESAGEEIVAVSPPVITETGPLRVSVRVERRWRDSAIVQTYRLLAGSRRLDIETEIDWHERERLVKALFPLAVHTHEATYETMYGVVRRPTHRNTSWDAARFEVCGHRFVDLSEPGYGVALLNDGKYGFSAHGNQLTISIVRGPLYPDPYADEGSHAFTLSLLPHSGDWTVAGVSAEAFALNSPLIADPADEPSSQRRQFVEVEGIELQLGALKAAEEGDGVVLRVHEPNGARGVAVLRFDREYETIRAVNLLEEPDESIDVERLDGRTVRVAIRPFQILTLRLQQTVT